MTLIFKDSAFKHGLGAADAREVLRNPCLVFRSRRGFENVYEVLGRTDSGAYLHLVTRRYLRGRDKIIVVFHMGPMSESDRRRYRRVVK